MDSITPESLGVCAGVAASTLLWWLLRGKVVKGPEMPSSSPSSYQTPVAKVNKLYVYPVKSCHRIEVESSECFTRGLKYDRCWVIITKDGKFCNQRWLPIMAQIQPKLSFLADDKVQLTLTAPDMSDLVLTQPPDDSKTTLVKVWALSGEGVDMGDQAGQWVSQFLKMEGCRMYYMAPHHKARELTADKSWTDITLPGEETSFADFCPVLVISEASIELLNSKLDDSLVIERFRPNIVVTGCLPHAEDNWLAVKVGGDLIMRGLKPHSRCKMTRVDPEQGYFTGDEPIKTLRQYRLHKEVFDCEEDRRYGNSPLFGYSYTVVRSGTINVGDTVYIRS